MDTTNTTSTVREYVDNHLRHRGLEDKWLYTRIGMPKGSYYDMWRRGSTRADVLERIAKAMNLTLAELLSPPRKAGTVAADPQTPYLPKRYLEQRVEELERRMDAIEKSTKPTKP